MQICMYTFDPPTRGMVSMARDLLQTETHLRVVILRERGRFRTALSTIVNDMKRSVHQGSMCLEVSLDCSRTFDRIRFGSAGAAVKQM